MTAADLNPGRLLHAAQSLAAYLNSIATCLPDDQREALPNAMARFITDDLRHITT
jgi:hypothetical protein